MKTITLEDLSKNYLDSINNRIENAVLESASQNIIEGNLPILEFTSEQIIQEIELNKNIDVKSIQERIDFLHRYMENFNLNKMNDEELIQKVTKTREELINLTKSIENTEYIIVTNQIDNFVLSMIEKDEVGFYINPELDGTYFIFKGDLVIQKKIDNFDEKPIARVGTVIIKALKLNDGK